MGDVLEIASVILAEANDRVEINAQNIANINTSGYKRRISFSEVLATDPAANSQASRLQVASDFAPGKPIETGIHSDLAISGNGFFVVRSSDGVFYTRDGRFERDAEGRLTNAPGMVLQAHGGGDLVVRSAAFTVTADGTVLEDGQPTGRIAVLDFADRGALRSAEGGVFAAPDGLAEAMAAPQVRQGFFESSNVSSGDEVVAMMETLRRAESAQRLVSVYDEMMGRALSTFGQT